MRAIVFGVLIAATDPVSVIATFKEAGVSGRLRLLIELESLLNDGTAAVAFVAVLSMLAGERRDVLSITGTLFLAIGGGAFFGATVGFGFMLLAERTTDYLVEITLATLAAYGSFFVAEHYHCSGVIAALTAGLVVGNYRPSGSISDAGRHALETFWEYVAFLVNSLIFILIGAQEAQQHFTALWLPVLVALALVTFGRAVAIYPLCAVFARSGLRVERRHQHILFWGGPERCFGIGACLGSTRGHFSPRRDCHYHVCCRRLFRVRARADDHAVAAPPGTIQIAPWCPSSPHAQQQPYDSACIYFET